MSTDLSEIRAALAAATPGPWAASPYTEIDGDGAFNLSHVIADDPSDDGSALGVCLGILREDANLIANAPTWLAELVDRVEAAEAERDAANVLHDYEIKAGRECCPCGVAADHWRIRYEDMQREAQKLGDVIDRRNAELKRLHAELDAARDDLEVADGLAVMYADLRDEALGNAMEAEAALAATKSPPATVGPWPIEQGTAHTHRWGLVAPGSDSRSRCQRCGVLR